MTSDKAFWFSLEDFADAIALVEPGCAVSFRELARRADDWVAKERATLPPGIDRPLIALEMTGTVTAIAAYLGCLRAGWPIILLAEGQTSAPCPILDTYRPNLVVRAEGNALHVRPGDPAPCPCTPDLSILLSTSGTTGAAKLVRLSAANLEANARAIVTYLGIQRSDRAISTLPLHYSYGMSVLHSYLRAGARLVLTENSVVDPGFWAFAAETGVTSLALVPTQFEMLAKVGFKRDWLPSLRYMTQAGGRLDPLLAQDFARAAAAEGWQLFIMYGQTEASPRMSYVPPEHALSASDTIGRPIPGGAFRLEDTQGGAIEAVGVAGELIYEGPNVMQGYALCREDLALPPGPPTLRTGDIAERTSNGYFRIVGRASRFVKLFGLRVGLDEIETRLRSEGHRVHVAGSDRGVVVFATDPELHDPGRLTALRHRTAAIFKLPESVILASPLPEVPLLTSGKVDYRRLSERAAELLATAPRHDPGSDILDDITRILRRARIDTAQSFRELGGDSLAYLEIEMMLGERLGQVPAGWENQPLQMLLAHADTPPASARRQARSVGAELPVRLLALSFVLLLHATQLPIGGGVFILTMLSGYSLARFQLFSLTEGKLRQVMVTMLLPLLAAYYVVLVPVAAHFGADWRWFALIANLAVIEGKTPDPKFLLPYWYVSAYAQILLMSCLPFLAGPVRRSVRARPFATGLLACLGLGLLLGLTSAGDLAYGAQVRHPLGAAQLLSLGWCIALAEGRLQKMVATGLIFVSWLMLWRDADPSVTVFLLVMPLVVLWAPPLTLPIRLAQGLLLAGSLTLYIYITHVPALYLARYVTSNPALVTLLMGMVCILTAFVLKLGLGMLFRLPRLLHARSGKLSEPGPST